MGSGAVTASPRWPSGRDRRRPRQGVVHQEIAQRPGHRESRGPLQPVERAGRVALQEDETGPGLHEIADGHEESEIPDEPDQSGGYVIGQPPLPERLERRGVAAPVDPRIVIARQHSGHHAVMEDDDPPLAHGDRDLLVHASSEDRTPRSSRGKP